MHSRKMSELVSGTRFLVPFFLGTLVFPLRTDKILPMSGKLIQNGVHLKEHEYNTVKLLLENGYDVELIPPSNIPGLRMPDIMLQGVPWEMKSPQGSGKKLFKNTIQNASHQSQCIIVDLRRCGVDEEKALKELEHYFRLSKRLKKMKVIKKSQEILDFSK